MKVLNGILPIILLYPISWIQFSVVPVLKLLHSNHALMTANFTVKVQVLASCQHVSRVVTDILKVL